MQVTPLRPGGLGLDKPHAADSVAPAPPLADAAAKRLVPTPATLPPVHAGLRGLDPQRNGRVAAAQQTLAYLERLTPRLRNLQTDLDRAVAGQPVPAERLESQRLRIAQLWNERAAVAGGELDAQLDYSPGQGATRRFTVRGLDQPPQARETLTLAVGMPSAARPSVRVTLDPDATPQAQAQAFDQALRPLGLRADAQAGGLQFTVAESRWPQVRDGLAVQGEGRQFAGGRLHRVAADPQPDALTPQQWALSDETGGRQAAQQLGQALQRAEAVRSTARGVLGADRSALADAAPAQDAAWAARFGTEFAASLQGQERPREGSYGLQAALGAALWGLGRQRVERLLDSR